MAPLGHIVARDLRSIVRGDVEFDPISRRLYATDAGLSQVEPLGVVAPRDTDDVVRLVRYAADAGIPLVARGMGSGLNGAAVGAGIQVDFTRYMCSILEVAPDASWVRVQPGVVMGSLNRYLRQYGVFFAPDPSSENHCSLGGMIGTNASGARSVAYGATKDHVISLEVVLSDGSLFKAQSLEMNGSPLATLVSSGTTAGKAFGAVLPELEAAGEAIRARMPRVLKNSCGYRVEAVLEEDYSHAGTVRGTAHLQRLFVGAEGTLGLVTEATLNLVPLPAERSIALAYFPSVFAAGEAVPGIVALEPTACEIMDSRFLALVRKNDSRIDAMLPEWTDTALLIEFDGQDNDEVDEKFEALRQHLDNTAALQTVRAHTAAETEHLWKVRKSAVALMQRMPGPRQPLPFIEDITVHPSELPACVDFLQRIFDREGVQAVMVGHAGDGNLHTRPVLDPRDPHDSLTMQRIYDEVSAYVLGVRGTMAGEHGDGLVHTPRLREMYGDELYGLFIRIKEAFDPSGLMNPGKKVGPQDAGSTLFRDVRYGPGYKTLPQEPILHFPPRGYEGEIERCHGCAACKSMVTTTMCPTYKATRREHASPRAKANLLRAIISGALSPEETYGLAAFKAVTDYCIECGMCAVECPSNVDIPKLMLEAKSKYRAIHRARPGDAVLGQPETVSRLGRLTAPLVNPLLNRSTPRRIMEALVGIDRRRSIAPFAHRTYAQTASKRRRDNESRQTTIEAGAMPSPSIRPEPTVVYFYDLFANYNDPELAEAVERVLQVHGLHVLLPGQRTSGIPEMLYGYADKVRRTAQFNIEAVLPYVQRGAPVVSAEPTATFAFKIHYPDYLNSPECSLVANATHDLSEFLVRWRADHPDTAPLARPIQGGSSLRIGYHLPCHLRAQEVGAPGLELLREIPGIDLIDLAAGCCGMAGTFGMKRDTYDLSMQTGAPLFTRIADVGPDLLASECSTCRMQLAQATGLKTIHPVKLLAEAYGT